VNGNEAEGKKAYAEFHRFSEIRSIACQSRARFASEKTDRPRDFIRTAASLASVKNV
jgi:hypothetical protein